MTAKEKAKELVNCFTKCKDKFNSYYVIPIIEDAKQCALIAVDEIIKEYSTLPHFGELYLENIEYLEEVKQEIEKL